MKKRSVKTGISLLLAAVLAVNGVLLTSAAEVAGDSSAPVSDYEYEEEYIQWHLDYCEDEEYENVTATVGSLAGSMALAYEEANLNAVNKTWDQFSSVAMVLGAGEVDNGLTNLFGLTNEYELIVSHIMQNSAAGEAFAESYEKAYLDAAVKAMEQTKSIISALTDTTETITDAGEDLGAAEDVLLRIDQILIAIQDLGQNASKEEVQTLFSDGLEEVKNKIDADFLAADKEKLTNGMRMLEGVDALASIGAETYSQIVDGYLLYSACSGATEQWFATWRSIADSAEQVGNEESDKLAAAINKILDKIEASNESMTKVLIRDALTSGAGNTVKYGISRASEAWNDRMGAWDIGKAVRDGLVAGITSSNVMLNCDDIAYYGEMLICTGHLAIHAWDELTSAEAALKSRRDFESAVRFDQIFNIYKEIQLAACDYAIAYYQEIATAPVGYVFKYTVDDEIAATVQILAAKADWSQYFCHEEKLDVINNGGQVVGYKGDVYYWKVTPGGIAQTGMLGNFETDHSIMNQLVRRSSDGTETVLMESNCNDSIYICAGRIYSRQAYSNWIICDENGTYINTYESLQIVGADTKEGLIIADDTDNGLCAIASDGTRTILTKDGNYLGMRNQRVYYSQGNGQGQFTIFSVRLDGMDTQNLGTITARTEEGMMASVGDAVLREDGIYLSIGGYGGTGLFFSFGGVYRVGYEGTIDMLVDPYSENCLNFPKIYVSEQDGVQTLYYYSGFDFSNAGFMDTYVDTDVYALNLSTMQTSAASIPLSNMHDSIFLNGSLQTLLDDSGVYTEILSAAQGAELGYIGMGDYTRQPMVFIEDLDIVDDTAYFSITNVVEDEASSLGWRTGYRRDTMKLYATEIGSGEFTLLNEY